MENEDTNIVCKDIVGVLFSGLFGKKKWKKEDKKTLVIYIHIYKPS